MGIVEFLLGIAESLIASFIFQYVQNGASAVSSRKYAIPSVDHNDANFVPGDARLENRRRLSEFVKSVLFRFVTFYLIYASVAGPLIVKAMLSHGSTVLSDARYVGAFLPEVTIEGDWIQQIFFLIATVLYLPVMYFVRWPVSLMHHFLGFSNRAAELRFALGCYLCVAAAIATVLIHLYYSVTIAHAASLVLLVTAAGPLLGGRRSA